MMTAQRVPPQRRIYPLPSFVITVSTRTEKQRTNGWEAKHIQLGTRSGLPFTFPRKALAMLRAACIVEGAGEDEEAQVTVSNSLRDE